MTRLKPHTVVVIRATFPFNSCEEYGHLLRLPVSAFYTDPGDHLGQGGADVPEDEAEAVADTLYDLCELVAMTPSPDVTGLEGLRSWASAHLMEIKRLIPKMEHACTSGDYAEMYNTAEEVREAAFKLAVGLRAYDAEQDSQIDEEDDPEPETPGSR